MREREREEKDRQMDRQTDRQTDRQRETEINEGPREDLIGKGKKTDVEKIRIICFMDEGLFEGGCSFGEMDY